jgi:hypothetical protein
VLDGPFVLVPAFSGESRAIDVTRAVAPDATEGTIDE